MSDDKNKQTIAQWQENIHWLARSKGWWDEKNELEQRVERELALVAMFHMPLSHALEEVREGELLDSSLAGREGAHDELRAMLDKLTPQQISKLAKLALVHSEITEAVEAVLDGDEHLRIGDNGKPEGLVVEVADAIIRCIDFCAGYGLDANEAVVVKHGYNEKRSVRHGGKLA